LNSLLSKWFKMEKIEAHEVFERIHMLLFIFALLYVFTCGYILVLLFIANRSWRKMEKRKTKEKSEITYFSYAHSFLAGGEKVLRAGFHPIASITRKLDRNAPLYHAYFHSLNSLFSHSLLRLRASIILEHGLAVDFDFSRYLFRSCQDLIIHLLDIRISTWVFFIFIVFLNWVRYKVWSTVLFYLVFISFFRFCRSRRKIGVTWLFSYQDIFSLFYLAFWFINLHPLKIVCGD